MSPQLSENWCAIKQNHSQVQSKNSGRRPAFCMYWENDSEFASKFTLFDSTAQRFGAAFPEVNGENECDRVGIRIALL